MMLLMDPVRLYNVYPLQLFGSLRPMNGTGIPVIVVELGHDFYPVVYECLTDL